MDWDALDMILIWQVSKSYTKWIFYLKFEGQLKEKKIWVVSFRQWNWLGMNTGKEYAN